MYLFNCEIVDQVVVVFIEAAVQRDTVGVKEQVLGKNTQKVPKMNRPSKLIKTYTFVMVDCQREQGFVYKKYKKDFV